MSGSGARVSARSLGFTYVGSRAPALADLDLDIAPGTETWVTGANASGKSTLLLTLAGVVPTVIEGTMNGSIEVTCSGVNRQVIPSMVMQDSGVYLFRTVFEEIGFPLENRGVAEASLEPVVREALESVGIAHLEGREMHTLSGGERQKVAVAAALAVDPDLLLLDEPFEQLDPLSVSEVLTLARARAEEGTTILVATRESSHLPDGAAHLHLSAGTFTDDTTQPAPVFVRESPRLGEPVLEMRGVSHRYRSGGGIRDVELAVREGESVAVLGPNGAGKTTLMKHAIGLLRPDSGCIQVCGRAASGRAVWELARDVGLLFQNPDDQVFNRTVHAEVSWGLRARGVGKDEALERAYQAMEELDIASLAEENPHELTASQRQLAVFASVLVTEPRVFVLDEPTKALDSQAAKKVAQAVDRRLAEGAGALTVTHDLRLAARMADRCVVLADGCVIADRDTAAILADDALLRRSRLLS